MQQPLHERLRQVGLRMLLRRQESWAVRMNALSVDRISEGKKIVPVFVILVPVGAWTHVNIDWKAEWLSISVGEADVLHYRTRTPATFRAMGFDVWVDNAGEAVHLLTVDGRFS